MAIQSMKKDQYFTAEDAKNQVNQFVGERHAMQLAEISEEEYVPTLETQQTSMNGISPGK